MAISTASNITSLDAFISALIAFAVAEAGYSDHGSVSSGGKTLYRISKTVDSLQTWYGLREETTSQGSHSAARVSGRMMLELPTDGNFTSTTNGQRLQTSMGVFNIAPTYVGYSFFTDGQGVFASLEITSGVFAHMAFGNVTKAGIYDGGAYLTANNFRGGGGGWLDIKDFSQGDGGMVFGGRENFAQSDQGGGCYIRYNIGGSNDTDFLKLGGSDASNRLAASGTLPPDYEPDGEAFSSDEDSFHMGMFELMIDASPSEVTFVSPLLPVYMFKQYHIDFLENIVPLGHVPNVASISMKQLADKELVNTDWRVFPLCSQIDQSSTHCFSEHYGIAYKEIT